TERIDADDGPVLGAVEGAGELGGGAVDVGDLDRVLRGDHRLGLAVDEVDGRVAGVEVVAVERETVAGRHGVRPGDRLVEPDLHAGQAAQPDAVDVELAGDGEVRLPEAQLALPREVRVGEEQAAAGRRAFGAE